MSPAHACWHASDHACFNAPWCDKALAYVADGPRGARLPWSMPMKWRTGPAAYDLPSTARLSGALAARYLNTQTDQTGNDGFESALHMIADSMRSRLEEDSATLMRTARNALRLGLDTEATRIIDMVFANDPGVPSFGIFDLPDEAARLTVDGYSQLAHNVLRNGRSVPGRSG